MRRLLVCIIALCIPVGPARAQPADYVKHPHLLFTSSDVSALQEKVRGSGTSAVAYRFIRKRADLYVTEPPDTVLAYLEGISSIPELGLVRHLEEAVAADPQEGGPMKPHVVTLGFEAKLRETVLHLARTRDVDADDFDSSLRLRSLALGYDMAFLGATASERQEVRDEILAYLEFMPSQYEYFRYAANPHTSNRGMMVGAAMGLGVMAIWDDMPTQQDELVPLLDFAHGLVVKCLTDILASDGSYREGVLYAGWMLRHAIPYLEARRRFDGVDLTTDPRLAKVAEWLCYEVLPEGGGRTNNINDSLWKTRPLAVHSTYLDWAQTRYGSGLAAYLQKHVTGEFGYDYGSAADKVATVLWNQDLPAGDPGQVLAPGRLFADRGIYFYRGGWKTGASGDEVLLSFQSSEFRGGHMQEDQNHFTLYAYGDRYAIDHGSPGASLEPKETDAHNVVIIDGAGEHNAGNSIGTDGRIAACLMTPFADYLRGDASAAYTTYSPFNAPDVPFPGTDWSWGYDGGNAVQRANRTLLTVKDPSLPTYFLIGDDIRKDDSLHEYSWLLHTDTSNNVDTSSNPVIISGAHSQMLVAFAHPEASQGLTIDAVPFEPGGEDPGSTMLRARQTAIEPAFFVALLPSKAGQVQPTLQMGLYGSTSASLLRLDWGAKQDDAVFNPNQILVSGSVTTNGKLALVRSVALQPQAYVLGEGSMLRYQGEALLLLRGEATVILDDETLTLSRDDIYFSAYGPHVTQVIGPNGPISFERDGDTVHNTIVSDVPAQQGFEPARAVLHANMPNPFRDGTRVTFTLQRPGAAHVRVYDLRGRLVRSLLSAPLPAGDSSVLWDGRDEHGLRQASGTYIVRLDSASGSTSRKIVVVR